MMMQCVVGVLYMRTLHHVLQILQRSLQQRLLYCERRIQPRIHYLFNFARYCVRPYKFSIYNSIHATNAKFIFALRNKITTENRFRWFAFHENPSKCIYFYSNECVRSFRSH